MTTTRDCVLLIDDEPLFIDVFQRVLQKGGYRETCRMDPREALEYFKANHLTVGLAVIDVSMPRISGIELSRLFYSIDPQVPIILITGSLEIPPHDIQGLRNVSLVLKKPFSTRQFLEAIASFVNKEETGTGARLTILGERYRAEMQLPFC